MAMLVFVLGTIISISSCGGGDDIVEPPVSVIKVSPTAELLGAEKSTTTITVSAGSDVTWTVLGAPEWLSFNKSGLGSSTVTITATQENFSDDPREATLTFVTDDGTASAQCVVTQKGVLAANCRVEITGMTVMADGFAGDLKFSPNCKGYREAFFLASDLPSLTERDVFNKLMEKTEYQGSLDYFASPYISPSSNPQAEIVYCIAAYGSETNPDGSHKYGRLTMKTVKTKAKTLASDMYLTFSYTTSAWKVITSRMGSYGQKCEYYYYVAGEGTGAEQLYDKWMRTTDAYFAHFYFKPNIEKDPDSYFKNGPQTMNFTRSQDKFCFISWGTNKDTGEFSAELNGVWYPTDFSNALMKSDKKLGVNEDGSIPYVRECSFKSEMPKFNVFAVEK